jgi:ubiquitin carboxyl-terminal hydrolase 4/11/15
VDYPLRGLDMRKHVISLKDEPNPVYYDLYGVSNHYGSLGGGHYTATCLNHIDNKWYYFNDSSVSRKDEDDVVSNAAYLLFYRRRD